MKSETPGAWLGYHEPSADGKLHWSADRLLALVKEFFGKTLKVDQLAEFFAVLPEEYWLEVATILKVRSQHYLNEIGRGINERALSCWCECVTEAELKSEQGEFAWKSQN